LGTRFEALQGLRLAAKLSGASQGSLVRSLSEMERRLSEGDKAFAKLHLRISDLKQMRPEQVFLRIADAIKDMNNSGDRLSAVRGIFGKSGEELLPTLLGGSAGIRQGMSGASKMSRFEASQVEKFNDAVTNLQESFGHLGQSLVVKVAPALEQFVTRLDEFGGKPNETVLNQWQKRIDSLSAPQFGKFRTMFNGANSTAQGDAGRKFFGEEGQRLALQQANEVRAAIVEREERMASDFQKITVAKAKAGQRFVELPGKLLGESMGRFADLIGDGADELGTFGDKLRATERSTFWAATKQMFGMGPFNPNATKGKLPEIASGFDASQVGELFGGRGMTDVRGNAALERGTAAAFSQERRSGQQSQLVEESKKHTQYLKQTVKALEDLKGQNLGAQLLPANLV
jgi:hypothetical protein